MTLPQIVAICGCKRSGKDTLADILVLRHGYVKVRIAEDLKRVVRLLFDFSEDQVETDLKDEVDARWGVAPRAIMQYFGSEVLQHGLQSVLPCAGRRFQIDKVLKRMEPTMRYVIPDMRFAHEYEAIAAHCPGGVYTVRMHRPSLGDTTAGCHVSEQEYEHIPVDAVVINSTGDAASLYSQLPVFTGDAPLAASPPGPEA